MAADGERDLERNEGKGAAASGKRISFTNLRQPEPRHLPLQQLREDSPGELWGGGFFCEARA